MVDCGSDLYSYSMLYAGKCSIKSLMLVYEAHLSPIFAHFLLPHKLYMYALLKIINSIHWILNAMLGCSGC